MLQGLEEEMAAAQSAAEAKLEKCRDVAKQKAADLRSVQEASVGVLEGALLSVKAVETKRAELAKAFSAIPRDTYAAFSEDLQSKLRQLQMLEHEQSYLQLLLQFRGLQARAQEGGLQGAKAWLDMDQCAPPANTTWARLDATMATSRLRLLPKIRKDLTAGLVDALRVAGWPSPVAVGSGAAADAGKVGDVCRWAERLTAVQTASLQLQAKAIACEEAGGVEAEEDGREPRGEERGGGGEEEDDDDEDKDVGDQGGAMDREAPTLWCVAEMTRPLAKRFRYHFRRSSATYKIDKPEWYMTHALKLVESHAPLARLLEERMSRPEVADSPGTHVAVEMDFAVGIVGAVREKLRKDCDRIVAAVAAGGETGTALAAHTLNEAVTFDAAVAGVLGVRLAGAVDAIAGHAGMRVAWEKLEVDAVNKCIKQLNLLTDDDGWVPDAPKAKPNAKAAVSAAVGEQSWAMRTRLTATVCGWLHGFVERVGAVDDLAVRADVVDHILRQVVTNVLDAVRSAWLRRVCRHGGERSCTHALVCAVINTSVTLVQELDAVATTEAMVELAVEERHHADEAATKDGAGADEGDSAGKQAKAHRPAVVEWSVEAWEGLVGEVVGDLCGAVVTDFVERSVAYCTRRELWRARPQGSGRILGSRRLGLGLGVVGSGAEDEVVDAGGAGEAEMTPELCAAAEALEGHLAALRGGLGTDQYGGVWKKVVEGVDEYLVGKAMGLTFGPAGGQRFSHDVACLSSMMMMAAPGGAGADRALPRTSGAAVLLTLPAAEARVILDEVGGGDQGEGAGEGAGAGEEMLRSVGVSRLNPQHAATILRSRVE